MGALFMSVVSFGEHGASRRRSLLALLLEESVELAEDVRDFIRSRPSRGPFVAPIDQLRETAEISRITSRVGFAVAWLMARNAVIAAEISKEESLAPEYRLGGAGVCDVDGDPPASASTRLLRLSRQSRSLYDRIARLDRELDATERGSLY